MLLKTGNMCKFNIYFHIKVKLPVEKRKEKGKK